MLSVSQVCMLLPQVLGYFVGTAVSTSLAPWASRDRAEMQCSVNSMIRRFVADAVGILLEGSGAMGALETWGRSGRSGSWGRRSRVARKHWSIKWGWHFDIPGFKLAGFVLDIKAWLLGWNPRFICCVPHVKIVMGAASERQKSHLIRGISKWWIYNIVEHSRCL